MSSLLIVIIGFVLWVLIAATIESLREGSSKDFIKQITPLVWIASVICYLVVYGSSILESFPLLMGFLAVLIGGFFLALWIESLCD